jgi:hypothetical protein
VGEPLDLEAIEKRAKAVAPRSRVAREDVPLLVAEIKRLREALEHFLWSLDGDAGCQDCKKAREYLGDSHG